MGLQIVQKGLFLNALVSLSFTVNKICRKITSAGLRKNAYGCRSSQSANDKESDKWFRHLADNINEAVILKEGSNVGFVNKAFETIWGIGRKELQKNGNIHLKYIHPDDLERLIFAEKINNFQETVFLNEEFRIKRPDGEVRWVWYRRFPVLEDWDITGRSIIIASDITQRKSSENLLFKKIIETEEREKRRFAEDLHDGLGPLLSSINMYLGVAKSRAAGNDSLKELISSAEGLVNNAISDARAIANKLTPGKLKDFGMVPALEEFCSTINKTGNIKVIFSHKNADERFGSTIENNFYRIAAELLTNTVKHAEASQAFLNLIRNGQFLLLHYSDNGKGFNFQACKREKNHSHGLSNIESRVRSIGGNYDFRTKPGEGVSVTVSVTL